MGRSKIPRRDIQRNRVIRYGENGVSYYRGNNTVPSYEWFTEQFKNDTILYLNKEKSTAWFSGTGSEAAVDQKLIDALSGYIMSDAIKKVKTEEDLANLKAENASMYQQQARLKGSIAIGERGRRIISLFEGADQSTFMHEMAHMFLMDLQEIASIDPTGREAKDLKTIMAWAEYKPGQAGEYKGTSSEAEFRNREDAIKAAMAAG